MDGQQRMTSLYQALRSGAPVDTTDSRGKPITRWYYLEIEAALNEPPDGSRGRYLVRPGETASFPEPGGPQAQQLHRPDHSGGGVRGRDGKVPATRLDLSIRPGSQRLAEGLRVER